MKLEVIKKSQICRDIKIEVSKEALKDIKDKVLARISQQVTIPGFRKGKAPLGLIERSYPDLTKEEVLKEAIPFYCNQVLKQENLEVVNIPRIKDVVYKEERLSFVAEVELRPQVNIDNSLYRSINIKKKPLEVREEEWKKFIEEVKEKISQVLSKEKKDISEDFLAKWLGYSDKDELKKTFYSEVYLNKVVQRKREIDKQIIDVLLSKVKFEIPKSLVEEQKRGIFTSQLEELRRRGIPEEEINKHHQEISKKAESLATDQVKLFYILEEIAKKEKLNYNKDNLYEVVIGFILSQAL